LASAFHAETIGVERAVNTMTYAELASGDGSRVLNSIELQDALYDLLRNARENHIRSLTEFRSLGPLVARLNVLRRFLSRIRLRTHSVSTTQQQVHLLRVLFDELIAHILSLIAFPSLGLLVVNQVWMQPPSGKLSKLLMFLLECWGW